MFYPTSLCTVSQFLAINFRNLLRLSFYKRLALKIRALWDVVSCRCINSSRRFRDSRCLHLQGQQSMTTLQIFISASRIKQALLHSRYVAVINSSTAQCKHKVPLEF
jgi:hypothetical protein